MEPDKRPEEFSIIVMGQAVEFHVRPEEVLRKPSHEALERTHQADTNLENWVLKTAEGRDIPFSDTEGAAGVKPGTELFLSPRTKSGGCGDC